MSRSPLVSVIVPAYNVEAYVAETLDSVLAQTYSDREIIVVDDGSTDGTARRLEAYGGVIRYVSQKHRGIGPARNAGLRVARGDYVAFLDGDDLWAPETLEVQLEVARRHPESGLIVCDGVKFGEGDVPPDRLLHGFIADRLAAVAKSEITGHFYRELIAQNTITTPGQALIPRETVEEIGPVVEGDLTEDWDYTLRVALNFPITFHSRALVRYRVRGSSMSGPVDLRQFVWTLRNVPVLRRHLRLCGPEDREVVRASLRQGVRYHARAAYYYGRERDPAFARAFLLRLLGRTWTDPAVLGWLLAVCAPEWALRWARRWRRQPSQTGEPS